MSPKPFRFGFQTRSPLVDKSWPDTARLIEELGFSSLLMPDHFSDQWGPVAALTAAAMSTTTLRVGALVFGNDYRHPVVLAKEMATLDQLSEGRLEFGIGAGWMKTDYEQSGMPYDRAGVRIERMQESLDIIRKCWAGEPFSYEGEHFTITDYEGVMPQPVRPEGPPIIIGGGGPRMLGVAAQNADIVGITANLRAGEVGPDAVADSMPEAFDAKVARVSEAAPGRVDDIELSSLTMATVVTDDREGTVQGLSDMFGVDASQLTDSPMVMVGSVDQICESLIERRERWGFNYVVMQLLHGAEEDLHAFAPVVSQLTGQ